MLFDPRRRRQINPYTLLSGFSDTLRAIAGLFRAVGTESEHSNRWLDCAAMLDNAADYLRRARGGRVE